MDLLRSEMKVYNYYYNLLLILWRDDLDKYRSDSIWQRTVQDRVIWRQRAEAFTHHMTLRLPMLMMINTDRDVCHLVSGPLHVLHHLALHHHLMTLSLLKVLQTIHVHWNIVNSHVTQREQSDKLAYAGFLFRTLTFLFVKYNFLHRTLNYSRDYSMNMQISTW